MEWSEFVDFLAAQVQELLETEYGQVRYGDVDIAYWLTGLLVGVVLLTIGRVLFRPTRHTRLHSGHAVDRRFQRGPLAMALYNAPKVLLALAMVGLSIALADPFLTATEEVTGDVESRVRIDLVDTSLSMAWEFLNTGRSRSEVAREAHLGFT